MTRRIPTLAALAAATFTPATLQATTFFRDYSFCTLGAFQACASVQVTVMHGSDGTSLVSVAIRNLQGTSPLDNTGGWSLGIVAVSDLGAPMPGDPNYTGKTWKEGASVTWNDVGTWGAYGAFSQSTLSNWINWSWDTDGVSGCTIVDVPNTYDDGGFTTCPGAGYGGAILYSFQSYRWVNLDDLGFVFAGNTVAGNGWDVRCDTADPSTCAIVPEPFTIALLGSGLAAMGGVGVLRRRKKHLE